MAPAKPKPQYEECNRVVNMKCERMRIRVRLTLYRRPPVTAERGATERTSEEKSEKRVHTNLMLKFSSETSLNLWQKFQRGEPKRQSYTVHTRLCA